MLIKRAPRVDWSSAGLSYEKDSGNIRNYPNRNVQVQNTVMAGTLILLKTLGMFLGVPNLSLILRIEIKVLLALHSS